MVLGVFWVLGPVLAPFATAAVLAYVAHPLVERLVRLGLNRTLAALVALVVLLAALLGVMLLVVPIVLKEWPLIQQRLPVWAMQWNAWISDWASVRGIDARIDPETVRAFVFKHLSANAEEWLLTLLKSASIGGSMLMALVGQLVLVPVVTFYLLLDGAHRVRQGFRLVPPRFRAWVKGFVMECHGVLGQYLRGQMSVMLALSVYYVAALALFGLDLALPVGVFTGMAVFVPYLGFGLGLVLAATAAFLEFTLLKALTVLVVVYGVGQLLESLVLTPRWVGERIGLGPLTVIFALLAFGHLLGFVGVLVALPASAVLWVAGKRVLRLYFRSAAFRG